LVTIGGFKVYTTESRFMRDKKILNLIEEGDESAIDVLYKKHFRMIVKMVMQNNGTEDEAKDIFQDSLIVFWQKIRSGELNLTSKISTYLYGVCLNLWRKELTRKSKMSNEELDVFQDEEREDKSEEKFRAVKKCIESMNDTCREILTLYYFDNLSMSKIAEIMSFANSDTVKTRKYKCKKELDRIVSKRYKEMDFFD